VKITLVEARRFDSLYRQTDGMLVTRPHGTLVKYDLDDDVLDHFWSNVWTGPRYDHRGFLDMLADHLTEREDVDRVAFCDGGGEPFDTDVEGYALANGNQVCDHHRDEYWECEDCNELYSSTTTINDSREVCDGCLDNNYARCDECDEYYHLDNGCEGEHDYGCDCESAHLDFTMRNDGEGPLAQDTRVKISLPAGVLSEEGIGEIARLLRTHSNGLYTDWGNTEQMTARGDWHALSYRLEEIGPEWQTTRGNYTKRLSRFAHKEYKITLPADVLSSVGNIGRNHSNGSELSVEITRNLNLSAEDFYHEDSCWWQSYSESRCALKTNGGIGMRTFGKRFGCDEVTGRAWVMPLRKTVNGDLTPTYDSMGADAFVIFNGYGELSGYSAARIVAHMAGMTYRKIRFGCDPMYVNNGVGYLVAPEDIAKDYTDGSLHIQVDQHSNLHVRERSYAERVRAALALANA
jgi:hypothetical protein